MGTIGRTLPSYIKSDSMVVLLELLQATTTTTTTSKTSTTSTMTETTATGTVLIPSSQTPAPTTTKTKTKPGGTTAAATEQQDSSVFPSWAVAMICLLALVAFVLVSYYIKIKRKNTIPTTESLTKNPAYNAPKGDDNVLNAVDVANVEYEQIDPIQPVIKLDDDLYVLDKSSSGVEYTIPFVPLTEDTYALPQDTET
eukprot:m.108723 g.108723  ORF g.108723 m.108723 type:complete len:198 (-) comp13976_c1_seq2:23-616(-)